jgi:hypothetical protein
MASWLRRERGAVTARHVRQLTKKGAGIAMPAPWMNHADASRAVSSPPRVCPKSPAVVIHAHCRKKPTDRSVERYPMNRLSRLLSRKM